MKYIILIADGMADYPVEELGGRTPLEAACKPNIDLLCENGRVGRVLTLPKRFPSTSDVAVLVTLGYNPAQHYPGRAAFEVLGLGLSLGPNEIAFRTNFVTVAEGIMVDSSAGHISTKEAQILTDDLNSRAREHQLPVRFVLSNSYRGVMIATLGEWEGLRCTPPHDIIGKDVWRHLPKGSGSEVLVELIRRSHEWLRDHDVNKVRADLHENPANMLWPWGPGGSVRLESFRQRFGISGAAIAGVPHVQGIARAIGWDAPIVPGATGYYDTDYAAKARAAVAALEDHDLVLVHVEAPDEAGHQGDALKKQECIAKIDELVLPPLISAAKAAGEWRMLILPDHYTPVSVRTHTREPVPFLLAGTGIHALRHLPFTEAGAAESDLNVRLGHELMAYFLRS